VFKKKILIVDDEITILTVLKRLLEKAGYKVITFNKAKNALEFLNKEVVDLVIIDLFMPDLNGIEFCRALSAGGIRTRILFMTGGYFEEQLQAFLSKNKEISYIEKPFTLKELIEVIKKLDL